MIVVSPDPWHTTDTYVKKGGKECMEGSLYPVGHNESIILTQLL